MKSKASYCERNQSCIVHYQCFWTQQTLWFYDPSQVSVFSHTRFPFQLLWYIYLIVARATHAQTAQFRMDTVANQLLKANGRKLELAAELKAIENEILPLIGAETFDGCQAIINQLLGNLRRKEETKTLNKLNRLYKGYSQAARV